LVFFNGTNGLFPSSGYPFIRDQNGIFHGVTTGGGIGFNGSENSGHGTLFKMDTNGTLTTLVWFNGTNGSQPKTVIQGNDGSFFGLTYRGGTYDAGTAFRVFADGTFVTLASFDGTNGVSPDISLIQATDGNFYGTAEGGGSNGYGGIFRLSVPLSPVFQTPTEAAGLLNLNWTSVAGQTYQLQYNSDLSSTNWNHLGSATIATNGLISATDSITDLQRFYRALVLP
jgi:uncharacterized repeat protein (TIGR03803 family)